MSTPTADKLVAAYVKLREAVRGKEDEIKALKSKMEIIDAELLKLCDEQEAKGLRTAHGTVSRLVNTRYWASDWDQMYKFIQENQAFHLLEKRIHTTNMKEFLEENPDKLPVGLQADSKYVIRITKPRNT